MILYIAEFLDFDGDEIIGIYSNLKDAIDKCRELFEVEINNFIDRGYSYEDAEDTVTGIYCVKEWELNSTKSKIVYRSRKVNFL